LDPGGEIFEGEAPPINKAVIDVQPPCTPITL
jgi:hypothetical protein